MILRVEIRRARDWTDTTQFAPLFVLTPGGRPEPVKRWAKAGPGEKMKLVLTVMLEGED